IRFIEENVLPENWGISRHLPRPHTIRSMDDTEDSIDTNEDESSNSNLPSSSRGSVRRNLSKKFDEDDDDDDEDDDEVSDSDIEIGEDEDEEEVQEKHRRQQKQLEERDLFVAQLYKFMD